MSEPQGPGMSNRIMEGGAGGRSVVDGLDCFSEGETTVGAFIGEEKPRDRTGRSVGHVACGIDRQDGSAPS